MEVSPGRTIPGATGVPPVVRAEAPSASILSSRRSLGADANVSDPAAIRVADIPGGSDGASGASALFTLPSGGAVTQGAHGGASVSAAPAANGSLPVSHGVSVGNVPIEIGLRSLAGTNHFEIRLAPDDLGRIDVRLDIDHDGQVKARLLVERPETLAFLQRDALQLQQALEQAGFKAQDGSVSMSLRDGSGQPGGQNPPGGQSGGQHGPASGQTPDRTASNAERDPPSAPIPPRRYAPSGASGLDLRI